MKQFAKMLFNQSPRQLYHLLRRRASRGVRLQVFDDAHPCVFVLSTGRAGTETLAALSSLAKNVFAHHEPAPRLYGLSRLAYEHFEDRAAQEVLGEAFRLARESLLQYSLDCERGYMETSPQVTFLAPVILRLYPGARFIHLVRNPRDVVRSGMRRKWFAGNAADKTRITPLAGTVAGNQWATYDPFQKNLWLWAETNRWILKFCSTLPAERKLMIRSEDMFASAPETFERLFAFVGAPLPPSRKIANTLGKRLNAQRTGDFPDPSTWSPDMLRDLLSIDGETAQALGYHLSEDA